MSDLYLILHKVRGEPAFDIAQKIQIGDEEGWIIPTSGHRAYPVMVEKFVGWNNYDREMFSSLPDHYSAKRDDTPMIDKLRAVLKFKTKPPLRRF